MPDTHPTAGARLLEELSSEADALVDAIEDYAGDLGELHRQATALANRVAIAKAILTPSLAEMPEPLKVRAVDWNWKRLDEVTPWDVVWDDTANEWADVDFVNDDFDLDGTHVTVFIRYLNGGGTSGKPSDVVRVADQALALAVDGAIDDLHEQFEREAI